MLRKRQQIICREGPQRAQRFVFNFCVCFALFCGKISARESNSGNFESGNPARWRKNSRRRELARRARTALGNSRREWLWKNFIVERSDGIFNADGWKNLFAGEKIRQIRLARITETNRHRQLIRAANDERWRTCD